MIFLRMRRAVTAHICGDHTDKLENRPQNTLNFLEEVEKHDFDIFKNMTNDFRSLVAGKVSIYKFCTASDAFYSLGLDCHAPLVLLLFQEERIKIQNYCSLISAHLGKWVVHLRQNKCEEIESFSFNFRSPLHLRVFWHCLYSIDFYGLITNGKTFITYFIIKVNTLKIKSINLSLLPAQEN